jgi:hypothetical protein
MADSPWKNDEEAPAVSLSEKQKTAYEAFLEGVHALRDNFPAEECLRLLSVEWDEIATANKDELSAEMKTALAMIGRDDLT